MRVSHRRAFLFGGTALAAGLSFYTDPDINGLTTWLGGLSILQGVWAVAAAHWALKAIFDYTEAGRRNLFKKSAETATGSGLALIALAIIFVGMLVVFAPRAQASELPPGFIKYGPVLKAEQLRYWSTHPDPALLAALVEQESCVTLKHKRCWNPEARLKSEREEGAGMGQITRTARFDALAGLVNQYSALSELTWQNVYRRPDLQLRALVLMSRDSANKFKASSGWLQFGDAAYNGGPSGVMKDRRACGLTVGCDPDKWFNNVENHCTKSRKPIYGNRSACDINREHVRNVFLIRRAKYVAAMT